MASDDCPGNPTRVTHVITRLIVGGAQENTITSVLGLRQKPGLQVSLMSGPTTGPEGSLEALVQNVPGLLTRVPNLVRPVHPGKDCLAYRHLLQHFRASRPAIVHTHSGKAGLLGRLAAHRAGVPIVVHTIHGPSFGPFQGWLANLAFRSAEQFAGRVTTHFVSVAHAMTAQYLAAGIGTPARYSTIHSGFDLAPFQRATPNPSLRARWDLSPEDIVVGKIARLFKLKGHAELLAAAPEIVRRFPRIKFLLVGDGIWRDRFTAQARDLGLASHFVFTGLVPPTEIPALVGIMDLLVHLSRREGLPRALPQALAAGKPVVAYDCDGAREVCQEGQTGCLIAPGDLAALTDAVCRLAENPGLRQQLGACGQQLAKDQFSAAGMVDALFALYQKLLAERKGMR